MKKVHEMKDADMAEKVLELREQLRKTTFSLNANASKNVREARNIKKTIAQILTEQTKRKA